LMVRSRATPRRSGSTIVEIRPGPRCCRL
jgi:hypothetical protein